MKLGTTWVSQGQETEQVALSLSDVLQRLFLVLSLRPGRQPLWLSRPLPKPLLWLSRPLASMHCASVGLPPAPTHSHFKALWEQEEMEGSSLTF